MHLKFERKWVYLLIIPACVMAIFLTLMLAPDMAMKYAPIEEAGEEESFSVPSPEAGSAPLVRLALRSGIVGAPPAVRAG
jgi:hypothetical protein